MAEGKGVNLAGRAIIAVPVGADKVVLGQNGAGTYYVKDVVEGVLANTAVAKSVTKGLGVLSAVKLLYDVGTYAYAVSLCKTE